MSTFVSIQRRRAALMLAAGSIAAVSSASSSMGANYYWDADGTSSTTIGGAGTWDQSATNLTWRVNSTSNAPNKWNDGNLAKFEGVAGTVTIGNGVTVTPGGITSQTTSTSSNYIIASGDSSSYLSLETSPSITTGNNFGRVLTISANIKGSKGLTVNGTGPLILSGNNIYTGNTTLTTGMLQLDSATALPAASTVVFGGGVLRYSPTLAVADYSNQFSSDAGQVFKVDTNGRDVTWATSLTSVGSSLAKTGAGTLTLGGASNAIGNMSLTTGTIAFANGANLGGGIQRAKPLRASHQHILRKEWQRAHVRESKDLAGDTGND